MLFITKKNDTRCQPLTIDLQLQKLRRRGTIGSVLSLDSEQMHRLLFQLSVDGSTRTKLD